VEHDRCAQCRNPIQGRQSMVRLARADMNFHGDCWAILLLNVQREYELKAQGEGLVALLGPYHRAQAAAWLPAADTDDTNEDPHEVAEVPPAPDAVAS
jgi:hypothetical protein